MTNVQLNILTDARDEIGKAIEREYDIRLNWWDMRAAALAAGRDADAATAEGEVQFADGKLHAFRAALKIVNDALDAMLVDEFCGAD